MLNIMNTGWIWIFSIWFVPILLIGCSGIENSEPESDNFGQGSQERPEYVLVIHGGAGTINKNTVSLEQEEAITNALQEALSIGKRILSEGGSSLDAVENVIRSMEDSPHFNAGKGAVFTHDGTNELDASIMDGATLNAGAVGGVRGIKNPISLARAVMTNSKHVMLTGKGAGQFALDHGFSLTDSAYFFTDRRWRSLQRALEKEKVGEETGRLNNNSDPDPKFGTVGAVALDKQGRLAAGTSTGGMTNKRYGRIGDSPIIGAGTYANDKTCAVSCTGHGEFFIRLAVAHDLHARLAYGGQSLVEASNAIIHEDLNELGGTGGFIAIDKNGNIAMPFNTEGMYRGYIRNNKQEVMLYKESE